MGSSKMKIFGYSALLMSAGIAEVPKSDANPKKRIETLGDNMKSWTSQHLCYEDRCLKAVSGGNWAARIDKVTRDTDEEESDLAELMKPRYNKDLPLKGIAQL